MYVKNQNYLHILTQNCVFLMLIQVNRVEENQSVGGQPANIFLWKNHNLVQKFTIY